MSYLEHFKLNEAPFRLTPDPEFVYWSKQHARAKAYMESTIWLADGFVVITGEIGSGKTTLLQSFLSELDDDIVYAVVSQTQLTPTQFLQAVLTEFGFKPFNKRKVELLDMLNMYLIEQYSNGKKVVLIVDEAQNLDRKVLEEIRMLSGIETHKEKVLRIILAGQPELKDTLESPGMQQLVQRVRLRFHIGPLDRTEMHEYIDHRIKVAGREDGGLFDVDTYELLFRYSGGVPRLINTLCDTALLCAFAEQKPVVGEADVRAAVEELDWETHSGITERRTDTAAPTSAPPRGRSLVRIVVMTNGQVVSEHEFGPGRVIAGRSPDNEIFIRSKFVSRHHAQFIISDQGCIIEDLNSTNGIFVDDTRVKKHRLRNGDCVSMGIHELIFNDLRESTAAPANEAADDPAEELADDDAANDDDGDVLGSGSA